MPTVCHEFDNSLSSVGRGGRDDRWRSSQRSTWGSRPLRTLVIKALPMIMVRDGLEG